MALTDELRREHAALWEAAVTHPFVREMGAGTLPLGTFQRYFAQDFLFVRELVKLVSLTVAHAPDLGSARRLTDFLHELLGGEERLFRETFESWGLPPGTYLNAEAAPVTQAFGDFLVRTGYESGFTGGLVCLVATEGTYLDWAIRLVRAGQAPATPPYRAWIEVHSGPDFADFVDWLGARLDALSLTGEQRAAVGSTFRTCLQYEDRFWEAAYRQG